MKTIFRLAFLFLGMTVAIAQQTPKKWTLQECVEHAVQNNLSVKQNELSTQLQEVEVDRAKSSFLPGVSGSFGADYAFGAPEKNSSFSNSMGIYTNATLYNGNRTKNAVTLAQKDVEISELAVEELKSDLAVQVVSAYMNVLFNREGVIIAQDQLGVGQKLLARMDELVKAGVKAQNDLFQVQATLAANEESLVTAQNNLELALLELSQLLQVPFAGFDIADMPITVDEAKLKYSNSEMIYNKALEWRPEIISANKQVENSDLEIANAKAGYLPTVTASYSFGTNYLNIADLASQSGYFKQLGDNRGHSLGVSASIPIFDKFNTKLNTQRAQVQKLILENSLETKKVNLQAEVERAYIDAKTSLKTFDAAKKSVEAQEEAFRTAQERYNLGILTSYDFEQVRNQLVQAQSSFIRAKYNFLFKSKFLEIYYGVPITL
ncbi:MAG: TolC family protein [Flavobacteriaceae bacterium]|jgi:outer membrane protein|nr:TolC family protein [Flavobacteriaceae bacterium]